MQSQKRLLIGHQSESRQRNGQRTIASVTDERHRWPVIGRTVKRWHHHPGHQLGPGGSSTTRRMAENWIMYYNLLYEDAYDPH